jgi:hypothetical protein
MFAVTGKLFVTTARVISLKYAVQFSQKEILFFGGVKKLKYFAQCYRSLV